MVLILVKRWVCTECTDIYDTELVNERPMCPHKKVIWKDGQPIVDVTLVTMRLLEEYWA